WRAGAASTCGTASSGVSERGCTSARWASCCGGCASGACPCVRSTPAATRRCRRRSKKLRRLA
ncbi:MAG: hypothetical protein AVDCRST_MAG31-1501, partial [uncultured Sphingomonas sp.]